MAVTAEVEVGVLVVDASIEVLTSTGEEVAAAGGAVDGLLV